MSANDATVLDFALKQAGKAILISAVGISVVSELVNSSEGGSVSGVIQNLVQVGGPTAIGAAAAYALSPPAIGQKLHKYVVRGAIAGGVATGVLIYAGALPPALDVATLSFVALVGASVAVGEAIVLLGVW